MKKPDRVRIALGKAVATVETGGINGAFQIHTAWVEVLANTTTPVHLHLEGKQGAITLKLPLVPAWSLSAGIHEQAIGFRPAPEQTPSARDARRVLV